MKSKKQDSKEVTDDEGIFQLDDLDPLTKQMHSLDVSRNDCEDGDLCSIKQLALFLSKVYKSFKTLGAREVFGVLYLLYLI